MKSNKWQKTAKRALGLALAIVLGLGALFYLVDVVFDGAFVSWFDQNFTITLVQTNPTTGTDTIYQHLNWTAIKNLLFCTLLVLAFAAALLCALSARAYAKRRVKQCVHGIAQLLRDGPRAQEAQEQALPEEYAEAAAQAGELRAALQVREQQLKEETGRKNDLVLYLAHDLKTPLASVIGYLNLLCDGQDLPPALRQKYLDITLQKAGRLEDLINEFFDIARFNLTDLTLKRSSIDLSLLLEQLAYEFRPLLAPKELTCELKVEGSLPLRCDADKLRRAFDNLLQNAVAYSYPKSAIEIAAARGDGCVVVTFCNRGETIQSEQLGRIFEQFYRLDFARGTKTGGAGLGLAIAKRIVELHGGTIRAESENERITFVVTLPFAEQERPGVGKS